MAGTTVLKNDHQNRVRTITLKCVSDASGDVSDTPIAYSGGTLYAFDYLPVTGVTDLWDIVVAAKIALPDGTSLTFADILGGSGANLSNSTNGGWVNLSNPKVIPPGSVITPAISNAGNAQTIYLLLHFWEEV